MENYRIFLNDKNNEIEYQFLTRSLDRDYTWYILSQNLEIREMLSRIISLSKQNYITPFSEFSLFWNNGAAPRVASGIYLLRLLTYFPDFYVFQAKGTFNIYSNVFMQWRKFPGVRGG